MTRLNNVIFGGPSLVDAIPNDLRHLVRKMPPIKRGDLDQLISQSSPPKVIGITDGEFMQSFSISPKEIIRAINSGMTIFGSSSIGALRAVELEKFGMIGIGEVFSWYRDGLVEDDDEVAMTYCPETFLPTSVPLINIRIALSQIVQDDPITRLQASATIEKLKSTYFPNRHWHAAIRFLEEFQSPVAAIKVRKYLAESNPDAKQQDAKLLIEQVANYSQ